MIALHQIILQVGAFRLGPLTHSFAHPGIHWIQGPNGCGKTTLLRTLLGRLKPQSGSFTTLPRPLGACGVEPLLFLGWTLRENLKFFEALSGRLHNPAEMQSLERLMDVRVQDLSLGWKRKAEISLLLALDYPTLLLDEPLSALDQNERRLMIDRLKKAADSGKWIFMTSHESDLPGEIYKLGQAL